MSVNNLTGVLTEKLIMEMVKSTIITIKTLKQKEEELMLKNLVSVSKNKAK